MTEVACTRETYFYSRPLRCHEPAVATFRPDPTKYPDYPPGNLDVRHHLCSRHAAEMRALGLWLETGPVGEGMR
jgi:hypothetical protein